MQCRTIDVALQCKAMRRFVARIDALLDRARNAAESLHVVVVGGGAGGVEVAFALHHRMHADTLAHASKVNGKTLPVSALKSGSNGSAGGAVDRAAEGRIEHRVSIFTRGNILSSHPARARTIIRTLAEDRCISIHQGAAVTSVSRNKLTTSSGLSIAFDECLWCTQAAPAAWLKDCDLPKGALPIANCVVLAFKCFLGRLKTS